MIVVYDDGTDSLVVVIQNCYLNSRNPNIGIHFRMIIQVRLWECLSSCLSCYLWWCSDPATDWSYCSCPSPDASDVSVCLTTDRTDIGTTKFLEGMCPCCHSGDHRACSDTVIIELEVNCVPLTPHHIQTLIHSLTRVQTQSLAMFEITSCISQRKQRDSGGVWLWRLCRAKYYVSCYRSHPKYWLRSIW